MHRRKVKDIGISDSDEVLTVTSSEYAKRMQIVCVCTFGPLSCFVLAGSVSYIWFDDVCGN